MRGLNEIMNRKQFIHGLTSGNSFINTSYYSYQRQSNMTKDMQLRRTLQGLSA